MRRFLPVVMLPLLLAGCATTFTNLTPQRQVRNSDNVYPVEVALYSRQQSLRWNTIRPQIVVGTETFPMQPTPLMTNRWEGLIPVPSEQEVVHYRYRFDFEYNALGSPKTDTAYSPEYKLMVIEEKPGADQAGSSQ